MTTWINVRITSQSGRLVREFSTQDPQSADDQTAYWERSYAETALGPLAVKRTETGHPAYPVTWPIGANDRARILTWASHITLGSDLGDAVTVGRNALPLLEFAEQATNSSDLTARLDAMSRQCCNSKPGSGDPSAFLAEASVHYAFITAGSAGGSR